MSEHYEAGARTNTGFSGQAEELWVTNKHCYHLIKGGCGDMLHLCAACKSNIKRYHNALKEAEERGARKENEAWCKSVCALCKGGDVPESAQCVSEKSWFHGEAYCHATEVRNRLEEK